MRIKCFFLAGLATVAIIGLLQNAHAEPLVSFYTAATATGPFNTVVTGPSSVTVSRAQSPDSTIYYDPDIGYNGVGGVVSQIGGASALAGLNGAYSAANTFDVGSLHAGAGTSVNVAGFTVFGWSASSQFGDTLFFTHTGVSASNVTTISFTINITGTLGDIPGGNTTSSGQPFVNYVLSLGGAGGISGIPQGFNQTGVGLVSPVDIIRSYGILGVIDDTITGSFQFTGVAAIIPMVTNLSVGGQYGYADVSDTATFSIGALPDGVSFTSASGDFLASGVPEPSTWAMMILGSLGLGFMAYRRKPTLLIA
jgi:hypothetical protein